MTNDNDLEEWLQNIQADPNEAESFPDDGLYLCNPLFHFMIISHFLADAELGKMIGYVYFWV